ncbi:hypothetical protein GEMRC1_007051 [Eukaryota sp. GEM-RC1]
MNNPSILFPPDHKSPRSTVIRHSGAADSTNPRCPHYEESPVNCVMLSVDMVFSMRRRAKPLPRMVVVNINAILREHTNAVKPCRQKKRPTENLDLWNFRNRATTIHRGKNAYSLEEERQKAANDAILAVTKEIKGLLNKLSEANLTLIATQFHFLLSGNHHLSKILSPQQLIRIRTLFAEFLYKKALSEPTYINIYSVLCKNLSTAFTEISTDMIRQCRIHFENFFVRNATLSEHVGEKLNQLKTTLAGMNQTPSTSQLRAEQFYSEEKLKSQIQTNMQLTASLILFKVISPSVADNITRMLVNNYQKRFAVEALITFLDKNA